MADGQLHHFVYPMEDFIGSVEAFHVGRGFKGGQRLHFRRQLGQQPPPEGFAGVELAVYKSRDGQPPARVDFSLAASRNVGFDSRDFAAVDGDVHPRAIMQLSIVND